MLNDLYHHKPFSKYTATKLFTFTLELAFLLVAALSISRVGADTLTDDCKDATELAPNSLTVQTIGNDGAYKDHDWYRVSIPDEKILIVTAHPTSNLDTGFDYSAGCDFTQTRVDTGSIGGLDMVALNNPGQTLWFDLWGKSSGLTPTFTYFLKFEALSQKAPVTLLHVEKMMYHPGDTFNVSAAYTNYTEVPKVVDIYVAVKLGRYVVYWPSWSVAPQAVANLPIAPQSTAKLNNFLYFTVPPNFPITGPVTIYTFAFDRTTGLWSNLPFQTCFFTK